MPPGRNSTIRDASQPIPPVVGSQTQVLSTFQSHSVSQCEESLGIAASSIRIGDFLRTQQRDSRPCSQTTISANQVHVCCYTTPMIDTSASSSGLHLVHFRWVPIIESVVTKKLATPLPLHNILHTKVHLLPVQVHNNGCMTM